MKHNRKRYGLLLGFTFLIFFCVTACDKKSTEEAKTQETASAEATTEEPGIQFPYEIDGGNFVVQSFFQSDIDNPDKDNEYMDGIASLELTNQSGQYCEEVHVTVTMLDGEEVTFAAKDIPDGASVWMFETSNKTIDLEEKCSDITCQSSMGEAQMMEDQISWNAEETTVTLQNITSEDLANVKIRCHCLFDGETYFGGTAYEYEVGDIPAGESVDVDAMDCYLGSAEVVKIIEE